ncbi:thioredoxin-domain-containing protein [Lactifluus subvellereus]|nr:thioredoxin-domain-containing protein [Lactifluus subvellereus]
MRLFPLLLVIASLAFGHPVQSAEHRFLTSDTFTTSIASGYWFVEHFSPYCHHCREFSSTWDELVDNYAGSHVSLAQVDCVVYGDLCNANGVSGYPHMNLYRDGTLQATFVGLRSHERIVDFIEEHTGVSEPSRSAPPPELPEHDLQTPHSGRNPHGEVLALTPETFPSVVTDGDVFVKFFAPWCGHCKKLAPTWVKLAKELQHSVTVAEVNCEDYKSLCSTEGVTGFPMLFFYPTSGKKTEYTGNRKFEALNDWIRRAVKPVFLELQYADFEQVVKDNSALYIALHAPGVSLPASLSQAARPLLGSPPLYISSAPELFSHFSVPITSDFSLIALKDGDTSAAAQVWFNAQTSVGELSNWLQTHRLPLAMELGEGSFQEVMNAESKPLVVLVSVAASGVEHDRIVETVRKLATQWRRTGAAQYAPAHGARQVVFTWMDQERWASWLKGTYGIKGPMQVVITDHSRLIYFDTTRNGNRLALDDANIFPALGDAMKGALKVRYSENIVERLARVSSLAFRGGNQEILISFQYINNKLIAIESIVSGHPWVTLGVFATGILAVLWAIKRLFLDADYTYQQKSGKEARLD